MKFVNHGLAVSDKHHLPLLTSLEQRDFDLIIVSAKECGWLDEECHVSAVVMDDEVMVTFTVGNHVQPWLYERTSRWLYQLLRDLAQGTFKVHS